MFKLFGVNRNVNGEIVEKHLIHSFSSGDFKNNVEDIEARQLGIRYMVRLLCKKSQM